jgi:hypothetical protein
LGWQRTGISTMVTRSFGDSLGASAITALPELSFWTIPDGSR